jgi:hypothetical protein
MMDKNGEKTIPVWGFPEEALAGWPADLRPRPVQVVPEEGPVLVHVQAVREFQRAAQPRPDGRLPDAILYLPQGVSEPKEAWVYFDAVVKAGDWEALRRLAACPRQFTVAEWAQEVPAEQREELLQELESMGAEEHGSWGAEGASMFLSSPALAPIPLEVQKHLAECEPCRRALARALEGERSLHWLLHCPPVARLAAHARGQADPWVEAHLAHCAACRGELAALQEITKPVPIVWLTISLLRQEAQKVAAGLEAEMRRQAEGLAALVNGLLGAGLAPVGAWTRRGEISGSLQPAELQDLLSHLQEGRPLTLVRPHRELELRWTPEEGALRLETLRGEALEPVRAFRVELRRGEEVLWQTDSQDGGVVIPLAELEKSLAAGVDALVILATEGG